MNHVTRWTTAALLLAAIAGCEPGNGPLAGWQSRCPDAANAIAREDRSRNGVALGCESGRLGPSARR